MVGAMALGAVLVAVETFLAGHQTVQRGQQVLVGTGPDFDDHDARRRVRDEDREEAIAVAGDLVDEFDTVAGDIDQAAAAPRPDGQLARLYGKMLRSASRSRPSPPPTGADS